MNKYGLKNVSKILTFILNSNIFFTACQQEQLNESLPEETQAPEVFFKNNYVAFNSIEVYDKTIVDLSKEKTLDDLKQINENPLSNLKRSSDLNEELYDDFLLSILNEDKIVQIGQWIIKVDMENEIVSVISEDNIDLIKNMVDDVENENIYKFTTEDDVLDLLEEGSKGTINAKQLKGWFCRDPKAIAHRQTIWPPMPYLGELYVRIRYYKAGIYYSLYLIAEHSGGFNSGEYVDVTIRMGYVFLDRCGRSYDRYPYVQPETKTGRLTGSNYIKKKVYESSRNLSKYYADAKFYLKMYQHWSLHSTWQTNNWMIISSNW